MAFTWVVDSPALAWTVRAVGLVASGFMVAALVFGQDLFTNPFFGFLYVWVWVGLVHAEPFETYALTLAQLYPWRADGQLALRSPLANLATLQPRPGLVAFVAVLIGSTGYDGFSNSGIWVGGSKDRTTR